MVAAANARQGDSLTLGNDHMRIVWRQGANGWAITHARVRVNGAWVDAGKPSGEYTLLYAAQKPSTEPEETFTTRSGSSWPDTAYKYQINAWKQASSPVALNKAGKAIDFFPEKGSSKAGVVVFTKELEQARVRSEWKIEDGDLKVELTLEPKVAGYFSLATPTLVSIRQKDIKWATVPGYFQGNAFNSDFINAYAYGQGIPDRPVVYRERCASTLSPILSTRQGYTVSVIADPGLGRDPWAKDKYTHSDWFLGLSHMNRKAQLSPTLYFPVLGEPTSALQTGQALHYGCRYSLREGDWFAALNHAVYDVYRFRQTLGLRHNRESLVSRMAGMRDYLTDRKTAMWNIEEYKGVTIGAQSYLGGVVGSQHDAMKNSDYGAMWMTAAITDGQWWKDSILPYARNFKLVQQQTDTGFFQGAAIGQYYLAKRKKFVEEWGEFVEPISLTYYTMLDLGNILLFQPKDSALRDRLRLGADLLMRWQKPDGSWDVAYERDDHRPLFTDLQDLRPTFYGLVVAYRILKDNKYLSAAKKGADWLVRNAVDSGHLIGVCGDARYESDFATAQTAQCLLDLYDITREAKYKNAAIAAAKIYTGSIYTQPVASRDPRTVNGRPREAWEIAQSGLSFEHGSILGSANGAGPIALASHAGLFVRMFGLTKDSLFLDMARAGAVGRDAFVDSATHVASYYWNAMNKGAGPYPHHAWWQLGWITDYLLAEAELRSGGRIVFPRGFVTPKVGPHQSYGFAPGKIDGVSVRLVVRPEIAQQESPDLETLTAISTDGKKLFVILLNDIKKPLKAHTGTWSATIPGYGISIRTINLNK